MAARSLAALRADLPERDRPVDQLPALLDALGGASEAWTHVGVRSFPVGDGNLEEDRYRALVREAQSRESLEPNVPFDDDGAYRDGARRPDDGAAAPVALVSIVLLVATQMPETGSASLETGLDLLRSMSHACSHTLGCEIVWMPVLRTRDGMPRAELEARAPRLRRV